MLAAGIVALFGRMIASLALVLAIIAVAYFVMRLRSGRTPMRNGSSSRRPVRPGRRGARAAIGAGLGAGKRSARRSNRQHVEVLGRVGLTRSSSAVVVQFADRVLLLGTSETAQPTVLAEIDAATWELCAADAEWSVPVEVAVDHDHDHDRDRDRDRDATTGARPTFLEALREATVRRA